MKHIYLPFFFVLLFCTSGKSQVGGAHIWEFLNLPSSARITALGGNLITVKDDDVALALANPAALNPLMHNQLTFNHNIHFAGINNGYFGYGHQIEKLNATFHAGMQYMSYGTFDAADEFGVITGEFKASEYAFVLGGGYQLYDRLSLGANLKLVSSQLETYNSFGLATDLAAFYQDSSGRFSASLLFKNVGVQLSTYANSNRESLPFEIQIGISQRLRYLPFRFSIIFQKLERWNIRYDDPNSEETTFLFGDNSQPGDNAFGEFADNLFRHFIFNGEFLFGKKENFRIRFGYNHFRRQEFAVESFRSLAGFSFGLGLKINRFRIDYGLGSYHLAGGVNQFSISTNLSEFRR